MGFDEYVLPTACLRLACAEQERGAFTLVLSGGSLLKALSALIGLPGMDFSRWHVFFVDERNVPHASPDSNFKGADEALLSKVGQLVSPYLLGTSEAKSKVCLLSRGPWPNILISFAW